MLTTVPAQRGKLWFMVSLGHRVELVPREPCLASLGCYWMGLRREAKSQQQRAGGNTDLPFRHTFREGMKGCVPFMSPRASCTVISHCSDSPSDV